MTDKWEEREKALENQYIYNEEKKKIEQMKMAAREDVIKTYCRNRCPKCSTAIEPITFRGVPLDKCPGCGGIWLGVKDLQTLASKDHRSWFEKWFKDERS